MNRRRKIYKGFNKRRRVKINRFIVVGICTCIIGGYTYNKIKNSSIVETLSNKVSAISSINLMDKIPIINKFKEKEKNNSITYEDISKELEEIDEDKENDKEVSNEVKLGVINGWNVYTIQVASIDNPVEIEKVREKLDTNKIPFSMLEKDGTKKVQTYSYFDENITRNHLEQTKKVFPDAFIAKIEIPTISLEYTEKYAYVESVSKDLNSLVANFKEESQLWANGRENMDMSKYNMILTKRKEILQKIQKNASKIDYKEMNSFKENLLTYTKELDEKIQVSSKAANEGKYNESESLFLSCIQGYLLFVNSIKAV